MSYTVTFADLRGRDVGVECATVRLEALPEFLSDAFEDVAEAARLQGVSLTGPPFARYGFEEPGAFRICAGFPVSSKLAPGGQVLADRLPDGRVAHTVHTGSYDTLAAAYDAATAYAVENGYEVAGEPWEVYLDQPDVPAPRTEVFVPCARVRAHHGPPDAG